MSSPKMSNVGNFNTQAGNNSQMVAGAAINNDSGFQTP